MDRSGSNRQFLDTSFSEEQTRSYNLSILLSETNVECLIYSNPENSFLGYLSASVGNDSTDSSVEDIFVNLIKEYEWLSNPFHKVTVLIQNPVNTLVPKALFDSEAIRSYLTFNQNLEDNTEVRYDSLRNLDSINVFAIGSGLIKTVEEHYPEVRVLHFSSVLIETVANAFKNKLNRQDVFLNVRKGYFDLLMFDQNKLLFYNLFRYKTKEDFIYFLLAALEQLELNPEEVKLHLMGRIDMGDRLQEMIHRYIRHSETIGRNDHYVYAAALHQLKHHHHYVLFNLI
jgi:hypothetical protein